jgi:hypothetical protein
MHLNLTCRANLDVMRQTFFENGDLVKKGEACVWGAGTTCIYLNLTRTATSTRCDKPSSFQGTIYQSIRVSISHRVFVPLVVQKKKKTILSPHPFREGGLGISTTATISDPACCTTGPSAVGCRQTACVRMSAPAWRPALVREQSSHGSERWFISSSPRAVAASLPGRPVPVRRHSLS